MHQRVLGEHLQEMGATGKGSVFAGDVVVTLGDAMEPGPVSTEAEDGRVGWSGRVRNQLCAYSGRRSQPSFALMFLDPQPLPPATVMANLALPSPPPPGAPHPEHN